MRPSFTSCPNTYKGFSETFLKGVNLGRKKVRMSMFHTLPLDARALIEAFKPEFIRELSSVWCAPRVAYATFDETIPPDPSRNAEFKDWIERLVLASYSTWTNLKTCAEIGRFGLKVEGAGKVRTFAIASPILQIMVRPLHDWVMAVLRTLPTDGTYDQLRPLNRLKGHMSLHSFDLKSATDLLPSFLSCCVLHALFGCDIAVSWYKIMTRTMFRSPEQLPVAGRGKRHRFTRGQPLGFYSSWPVFTLTHHLLVWMAAYRVYPGQRFLYYAILGDDIVIADNAVAKAYRDIMSEAQAVISNEKTLVSHWGACEFAKRFRVHCGHKDISPVSVACIRLCSGFPAPSVFKQLGVKDLRTAVRLRGGGYHVYNNHSFKRLSKRWKRHWLSMHCPSGILPLPFEIWLATPEFGVLSCYQKGAVRAFLLARVKPKELKESSFDLARALWGEETELFEQAIAPVVQAYCESLTWYARVYSDPLVPLVELIEPPEPARELDRVADGRLPSRYGLIFKVWDYLRVWKQVGILTPTNYWVTRVGRHHGPSDFV